MNRINDSKSVFKLQCIKVRKLFYRLSSGGTCHMSNEDILWLGGTKRRKTTFALKLEKHCQNIKKYPDL